MAKNSKPGDTDVAKAAEVANSTEPTDLPQILAGEATKAAEAGVPADVVAKMQKQLEQLTGIVEKQNEKIQTLQAAPRAVRGAVQYVKCPTCRQAVNACKGEHVTARILPKNAEFIKLFGKGLQINGEYYFGHCVVPKSAANEWLATVANFERVEREQMHNRGHIRGWERDLSIAEAKRDGSQLAIIQSKT